MTTNNTLKVWSRTIKSKIDDQIDDIYKRDYKFYKIDRLERIAERIDEFSHECEECEALKTEVEDITEKLSEYLQGIPHLRAEYEKRNEKIVKHLQKKHKLAYKEYFAASYSFIGFTIGSIISGGIMWFINPNFVIPTMLMGFALGIIIGRILGKKKDKKNEKNNLIL